MASRDQTRTRLLDAADELFFTDGIVATPVDRILERAGVSPATLYRAYGSKEGLVAGALERRHRAWLEVWDQAIERADDDRARLLAVFAAVLTYQRRPDGARWCAFLGTAAEYADPPPALAEAVARDTDELRRRLTHLATPLRGPDAPALADQLVLLVSGALAMRLRGEAATAVDVARAIATTLVDRAGGAVPSGRPAPGAPTGEDVRHQVPEILA